MGSADSNLPGMILTHATLPRTKEEDCGCDDNCGCLAAASVPSGSTEDPSLEDMDSAVYHDQLIAPRTLWLSF
jgi:hypothetical protein